jgi:hypothetical protein
LLALLLVPLALRVIELQTMQLTGGMIGKLRVNQGVRFIGVGDERL